MRSAETSGVGGEGFGHALRQDRPIGSVAGRPRTVGSTALVITLAAIVAAALSVSFDYLRTLDEHGARRDLVAQFSTPGEALAALVEGDADLSGVWMRGTGAIGLAALIAGLAWWRTPRPVRRPALDYGDLLATIPFGVACWTSEGELITCNEQYRSRLNLRAPLPVGSRYPTTVRQLAHGGSMQLIRENESNRLLELRREDGSCLLIDERPLAQGGFITLISDVTETRRTDQLLATIREEQRLLARRYHEEKLKAESANRAKTAFLAHLSHDIRTPLNHIIGFAELMRQQTYGALGDERYLNYVEAVKGSGERLLSYFASILELAELEAGRRPQRLEPVNADELLLTACRRFSGQAQQAGVILRIGTRCEATVLADRFSLDRMMNNLVENALRFTPSGGRVTIAAYAATDGVVLEITDTGIGIPPERLETLSQPFAFRDDVLTREQNGAGLGIAIARAIAETCGGRLAIDSRIGLGTTVAISLPLQPAMEMPQAVAA
ncbi:MAG: PAS domain-containing sensor histidine kinase [Hyphomicrobiales bacterium]|nr:MAG: PAS domain-containing sensor histidine kinase [Hyphomicrobiales bacterium]